MYKILRFKEGIATRGDYKAFRRDGGEKDFFKNYEIVEERAISVRKFEKLEEAELNFMALDTLVSVGYRFTRLDFSLLVKDAGLGPELIAHTYLPALEDDIEFKFETDTNGEEVLVARSTKYDLTFINDWLDLDEDIMFEAIEVVHAKKGDDVSDIREKIFENLIKDIIAHFEHYNPDEYTERSVKHFKKTLEEFMAPIVEERIRVIFGNM